MNKILLVLAIVLVTGCASGGVQITNEQIGCAAGAVGGGIAGYQYTESDKGQAIATAIGAGAGCAGGAWVAGQVAE